MEESDRDGSIALSAFSVLMHVFLCTTSGDTVCFLASKSLHMKLMPTPNCKPFLASSPLLSTIGKPKFSSNLATGCA